MNQRLTRRLTFDRVAELYDRARPGYPAPLFDLLARPGLRVLEIGCGTGKASVPLVERGCLLLAVELGPNMARIARHHLAAYERARVVVADFDTWEPDEDGFDVVFSATAFHWLDPATKFRRTAALLRPGGILATVRTSHIAGGTPRFFADAQACYRRFDPNTPDFTLPTADSVPFDDETGDAYRPPTFHRWEWTSDHTTAEYLDMLRTYSANLVLSPVAAEGMLRCIGALADAHHGGHVTRNNLTELRIAQRA